MNFPPCASKAGGKNGTSITRRSCRHSMAQRNPNMKRLSIGLYVFFILLAPSAFAQFRYEFHDTPSPEANVMVVFHSLSQGSSAEMYLEGRVFNRGLKPARNVRVVYAIRSPEGAQLPGNPIYLTPSDVPPTSYADFKGRLPALFDPRDYLVQVTAEWDE